MKEIEIYGVIYRNGDRISCTLGDTFCPEAIIRIPNDYKKDFYILQNYKSGCGEKEEEYKYSWVCFKNGDGSMSSDFPRDIKLLQPSSTNYLIYN